MAKKARVYKDHAGKFRYGVKAGNGRTIDTAEQGFTKLEAALDRVMAHHPDCDAITVEYTRYAGTSRAEDVKYDVLVVRGNGSRARRGAAGRVEGK